MAGFTATAKALATVSLVAALLTLPTFLLQLQTRNKAVIVLVGSILILSFQHFINALIWHNNNISTWWDGEIFCDIQSKILIAANMTIPGALTCIFRQLYLIFDPAQGFSRPSKAQNRITVIFETVLCVLLPVLSMIVSYTVQPERYWIFGPNGCTPSLDRSWLGYVLVLIWPTLVCSLGGIYAGATIVKGVKHYREASKLLTSGLAKGTQSRLIRTFALAIMMWLTITPFRIWNIYLYRALNRNTYSWSRVHPPDWSSRIVKKPFDHAALVSVIADDLWSIVSFGCLGCGHEAMVVYRVWWDHTRHLACLWRKAKNTIKSTSEDSSMTVSVNPRFTRDFVSELESTQLARRELV